MSQKNFQIFRSQISDLKTDNVDYLKKPPRIFFYFFIFAIHSSSRHEKCCQISVRLFSLFRGSIYQQWITHTFIYTQNDSNFNLKILSIYFEGTTLAIFEDCITFRHKMQSFPCSILTFGYQSCFLGPPKVEIQWLDGN